MADASVVVFQNNKGGPNRKLALNMGSKLDYGRVEQKEEESFEWLSKKIQCFEY